MPPCKPTRVTAGRPFDKNEPGAAAAKSHHLRRPSVIVRGTLPFLIFVTRLSLQAGAISQGHLQSRFPETLRPQICQ